jgi:Tfp pilus tip-associated adhesin PilY1
MLHILDGGIPRRTTDGGAVKVEYDRGTGREMAAYIPRAIMPTIKAMADGSDRFWSVDGGLRVADVRIDPAHAGMPDESNREWRTVLVAGLRRGGESVYALDITQPDKLTSVTVTEPFEETVLVPDVTAGASVATCWANTGDGDEGCDEDLTFPHPLWEFDDTVEVDDERMRLDEDFNGEPDLAQTWSIPNVGRIQVEEDGSVVDKFVAIFGGGLDPERPGLRGNWLYIVDIETGKAIYKYKLDGSTPSEPAAVDTNQDGLLDRVYIGTTRGFIYRLDLGPDAGGSMPLVADHTVFVEVDGVLKAVVGERRFTDRVPRVVFDNVDSATGRRLPFFFRPSIVFSPLLSPNYALAVGDGDRENLWSRVNTSGRFYVFVDDTDQRGGGPITADNLARVTPDAATTSADYLLSPDAGNRNGWYMQLEAEERVVANAFALSGVLVFSTFQPEVEDLDDPDNRNLRLCARRGESRAFAVLATNANGVLFDENSNRARSMTVNTLVSKAFADLATTRKPPSGDDTTNPAPPPLPPDMQLVMDELKKLFPSNCRFASYRVDIRAVAADTEVVEIAPVPVCVIEKNWREF